jgi:hypothetical protein
MKPAGFPENCMLTDIVNERVKKVHQLLFWILVLLRVTGIKRHLLLNILLNARKIVRKAVIR